MYQSFGLDSTQNEMHPIRPSRRGELTFAHMLRKLTFNFCLREPGEQGLGCQSLINYVVITRRAQIINQVLITRSGEKRQNALITH